MKNLSGNKIALGVTGSIAAYKAAEIVRLLRKINCEVQVIMSDSAKNFVQPLTFQSLSGRRVYDEMFDQQLEINIGHISIAHWADLILIAPATANIIGKIANGIADDLLSTICMAFRGKIAIAPAMNCDMWLNEAVQKNVSILRSRGYHFLGPVEGPLACGTSGVGRMIESHEIIHMIEGIFTAKIFDKINIMITAGPTRENLDPVRFISNYSSGKMGYAIAAAAQRMGANVTLISGPTNLSCPHDVKIVHVKTAEEMNKIVLDNIIGTDIFIGAAAVADYKPKTAEKNKIKKHTDEMTLELVKTPDILKNVTSLSLPPFTVGFSAETDNLVENARKKLTSKNIDVIAANIVGNGRGFNAEDNELILIAKDGSVMQLGIKHKSELAEELLIFVSKVYSRITP